MVLSDVISQKRCSSSLQIYFWVSVAAKQIQRIRQTYFRKVMQMEIGWFDCNSVGELNTRISEWVEGFLSAHEAVISARWENVLHTMTHPFSPCSDINRINNAISDQVPIFIERLSTFVFGFMVGFIGGWKLTLVVIAVSPLLGLAAGLMALVKVKNSDYTAVINNKR